MAHLSREVRLSIDDLRAKIQNYFDKLFADAESGPTYSENRQFTIENEEQINMSSDDVRIFFASHLIKFIESELPELAAKDFADRTQNDSCIRCEKSGYVKPKEIMEYGDIVGYKGSAGTLTFFYGTNLEVVNTASNALSDALPIIISYEHDEDASNPRVHVTIDSEPYGFPEPYGDRFENFFSNKMRAAILGQ